MKHILHSADERLRSEKHLWAKRRILPGTKVELRTGKAETKTRELNVSNAKNVVKIYYSKQILFYGFVGAKSAVRRNVLMPGIRRLIRYVAFEGPPNFGNSFLQDIKYLILE